MHRNVRMWVFRQKPTAPDPGSIEMIDVIEHTELFDRFRAEPEADQIDTEGLLAVELSGRHHDVTAGAETWGLVRRLAETGRLSDLNRDLQASKNRMPLPPRASVGLSHASNPTTQEWAPGFSVAEASLQLPMFATDVPERWFDALERLLHQSTIALGAYHGWVMPSVLEWDVRPAGIFQKSWMADVDEEPLDAVVGLAPVFVVGPHALPRYGGLDGLSRDAPVHTVTPIDYPDDNPGALVRLGTDHTDVCNRWADALSYFGGTIRTNPVL